MEFIENLSDGYFICFDDGFYRLYDSSRYFGSFETIETARDHAYKLIDYKYTG